jgi:hypothetical protein
MVTVYRESRARDWLLWLLSPGWHLVYVVRSLALPDPRLVQGRLRLKMALRHTYFSLRTIVHLMPFTQKS